MEGRVSHISQRTRDMGHPLVRCAERVKMSQALGMTVLFGSREISPLPEFLVGA